MVSIKLEDKEIKEISEAILFSAGNWISIKRIIKIINKKIKEKDMDKILNELMSDYEKRNSSIIIKNNKDQWKMDVKNEYLKYISKLSIKAELNKSTIETLSYIAWEAPVLQSKIIKVRGKKAYADIKELIQLSLIKKKKKGKTYVIDLTNKFFDYFSISNKNELKKKISKITKENSLKQRKTENQ